MQVRRNSISDLWPHYLTYILPFCLFSSLLQQIRNWRLGSLQVHDMMWWYRALVPKPFFLQCPPLDRSTVTFPFHMSWHSQLLLVNYFFPHQWLHTPLPPTLGTTAIHTHSHVTRMFWCLMWIYSVVRNPGGRTGIRGRGSLSKLGQNIILDLVVTR